MTSSRLQIEYSVLIRLGYPPGIRGCATITATAFDAKGRTARATLRLSIDNELGKGAEVHAETALEALKERELGESVPLRASGA